jgi:hypothetical protein
LPGDAPIEYALPISEETAVVPSCMYECPSRFEY